MYIKALEDGNAEHRKAYEWKSASVNVAGTDATTLLTAQAGFTTLFNTVKRAHRIAIKASATAYIRLNTDSSDKITVDATTPFTSDFIVVDKIYVSTGGSAVTITVILT